MGTVHTESGKPAWAGRMGGKYGDCETAPAGFEETGRAVNIGQA